MTTYSHEADWSGVLPRIVVSHRSTTSSRRPGRTIEGSVQFAANAVVPCAKCGHLRRASAHPHSTQVRKEAGVTMLVDCVGTVLEVLHVE